MSDVVQVTTALPDREAARALGRTLVERRLAACAQVLGPVESSYWWEGALETAEEWLCLLKTRAAALPALEAAIREAHPYEVPEILAVPASWVSPSYAAWLQREVPGNA